MEISWRGGVETPMPSIERLATICLLNAVFLLAAHQHFLSSAVSAQKEAQPKSDTQLIHSVEGHDLYRAYCASCHGMEAHGDGPAASALKTQVPDLTLISKRSNGSFPANRIRKLISGEESPASHGSREMPIWGPVFHQVEADQDWGNVRLESLTRYLESIQKR